MRNLEAKNRLPLYVQVKNHIADAIDSGVYPPGSKLPTEHQWMAMMNVGRGTVRSALTELEHEGKIVKRHGIGTFAGEPKQSFSFEPVLSLTYSLRKMGLKTDSVIMAKETVLPAGRLLDYWGSIAQVGRLKRIRFAGGKPVAVEDSYFLPDIFKAVCRVKPGGSVAREILAMPGVSIAKAEFVIEIRKPDTGERSSLRLPKGENVAELTRWTFVKGAKLPISFVSFVMPENMMSSSALITGES